MSVIRTKQDELVRALVDQVLRVVESLPGADRAALYAASCDAARASLSSQFGGAEVCFFSPQIGAERRRERSERIAQALARGDAPEAVARREGISARHARRVRGRIGG